MTDLRTQGTRVLYVTPEGHHVLGTTEDASDTVRADCAVVRFDDAPFIVVMPVEMLRVLSGEDEKDLIVALNDLSFEKVRRAVIEAQQRLNHTLSIHPYAIGRSVTRRAAVKIEHTDFAGHDETWTITISAKSMQLRGP